MYNSHSPKDQKFVFKTNYRLMQVIKLPIGIKIFVLSIFEWPFYTDFIVVNKGSALKNDF